MDMLSRPLPDHWCCLLLLKTTNLSKVRKKVRPHNVVLVDISALDLTHSNKVIGQERSVVVSDSSHFVQALVCVKCEFLTTELQSLCFICQHELKSFFFVSQQLFLAPLKLR